MEPVQLLQEEIQQADLLHDEGRYAEALRVVLDAAALASSGVEKAELLWRASRDALEIGREAERSGAPASRVMEICLEGERYADESIEADPGNEHGYFWKSSNMGRRGQLKGVLKALSLLSPMRDLLATAVSLNPEFPDAYFVLGQMYREVPGWPLSFGNVDSAVSLGRKSVNLGKATEYDLRLELALSLRKRNWDVAARQARQEDKRRRLLGVTGPLERAFLYEADVVLGNESDREEAERIVHSCIAEMEKLPRLSPPQTVILSKARNMLSG